MTKLQQWQEHFDYLRTGDVVRLKSGERSMTVRVAAMLSEAVECDWISDDGKHHRAIFRKGQLWKLEAFNDPLNV
jgi:uncharacterized protein YodC (DUF2158 family)